MKRRVAAGVPFLYFLMALFFARYANFFLFDSNSSLHIFARATYS